jgi:hypothetical protein
VSRRLTGTVLAATAAFAAITVRPDVPRETSAPVEPSVIVPREVGPAELPPEPKPDPEPAVPLTVREKVTEVLTELGRQDDYACLDVIFAGESSWRPDAIGDGGDSFGLGQRNAPAHGAPPWPWPVRDQVLWFLDYADERYGGPCAAAEVWQERADARDGAGWW